MKGSIRIKQLHRKLDNDAFELAFANKEFRPGWFTHEAHIRLAFIHIKKYGYTRALSNIREQIRGFAENLGIYDKYHDTVTVAAVIMTAEAMENTKHSSFQLFIEHDGAYLLNFKDLLNEYYSYNLFKDQKSRTHWVAPDKRSFPQHLLVPLQPVSATK
jgi:hypothetical protein